MNKPSNEVTFANYGVPRDPEDGCGENCEGNGVVVIIDGSERIYGDETDDILEDAERLRRWRLLLGGETAKGESADGIGCELGEHDRRLDAALAVLEGPLATRDEHQVRARFGVQQRGGRADARGSARQDHHFALVGLRGDVRGGVDQRVHAAERIGERIRCGDGPGRRTRAWG